MKLVIGAETAPIAAENRQGIEEAIVAVRFKLDPFGPSDQYFSILGESADRLKRHRFALEKKRRRSLRPHEDRNGWCRRRQAGPDQAIPIPAHEFTFVLLSLRNIGLNNPEAHARDRGQRGLG